MVVELFEAGIGCSDDGMGTRGRSRVGGGRVGTGFSQLSCSLPHAESHIEGKVVRGGGYMLAFECSSRSSS